MVWLKTFKHSALRRQPEDVEYCFFDLIITDAIIQVWGCFATSLVRYQRSYGMRLFRLKHNSGIITNT
ncbi:hypothetical protein Hanom_Chr04g00356661 [Helianthus anomalus]